MILWTPGAIAWNSDDSVHFDGWVHGWIDCVFNDIRPAGHISRPTNVGFSHSCLWSIEKWRLYCRVLGSNSPTELHPSRIGLNEGFYFYIWQLISDRMVQVISGNPLCKPRESSERESSMSQDKSTGYNWQAFYVSNVYASSDIPLWHDTGHDILQLLNFVLLG